MKTTMRIFITSILILLIFGCQNQKEKLDGFLINGNVKNLNNSELLVLKFVNGGIELDSISVTNDEFQYSGKVKEPYFIQILIRDGKETKGKLTEFMIENSEITITGNSIEYDSVVVSGSNSDKILKEYLKKDEVLSSKWNDLKLEYDKYVELGDTTNRKAIAKKLNYILNEERVGLLKKYVSDYSNTTVGALLPSFCTIENALKKKTIKHFMKVFPKKLKNLITEWEY